MTLKYPMEAGGIDSDYITFAPMKYRANARGGSGAGGSGAAPPSGGAESVILYMPNSTPGMGNPNDWGRKDFSGPIGELQKGVSMAVGQAAGNFANGANISGITQNLTEQAKAGIKSSNWKGAGIQAGLRAMSKVTGQSPNTMLAMGAGQVYNPNVELIYTSPQLRTFSLSFDMIPKSASEAQMINRIILNFKKWSSPMDLKNGMFEVPYVWQINYMTGGKVNTNMNRFKKAACTNVTVQANTQTPMHVAHEDGVPVITSLQLDFQEVDIITRQDHEEVMGQGY